MNSLIVQDTKDGAILTVHVQPKASTTECAGIHGDALKIRVAVPPVDGAANTAGDDSLDPWSLKWTGEALMHKGLSVVGGALLLTACSTAHPILYPNAHRQSVGTEIAEKDVEACRQSAESAGAEEGRGKAGRVATGTAVGGGVGAAAGAVGGAISGAVGRGSMIGAATGAVWGLLTGLYHVVAGPSQPNQAYTNFVNRCLQEKGYEVTGWQ